MRDFDLVATADANAAAIAARQPETSFIAGGTDLLQLMKQNVERAARLVDLDGKLPDGIEFGPDGLRLGALARMADVAAHPAVQREAPAVAQALLSAASPQVRNMGTMGGNLLQRTRCLYFRDTGFPACNKRAPGTGCGASRAGANRMLGILGVSEHCIATHPSDMPVALAALDAVVLLQDANGATRQVPITQFYRLPGSTPHIETVLEPGELVTGIVIPQSAAARNSRYLKVRDRASFEFALVSCAVAIAAQNGVVRDVRIALGGVAPMPWRATEAEKALLGGPLSADAIGQAAAQAANGATPASENGFKVQLSQRVVRRALLETMA